jgi:hypothetical protein
MQHVIRIRYKGRIHTRKVTRNFRNWFIIYSRGKEYRFERGPEGWTLTKGELPMEFIIQIMEQLEELYQVGKGG